MEIVVENLQKKTPLNAKKIRRLIKKILASEGVKKANLSFVFVSSAKIRALNKKYLKRDYATDVLAFDLNENGVKGKGKKVTELWGDIIICTDVMKRQAKENRNSFSEELALYIAHGILHLLGYDDHKKSDVIKMRKKEESVLSYCSLLCEGIVK